MSENQIQNRIIDRLNKAKETEGITCDKVYEIFRNTICDILTENTVKSGGVKSIVKDGLISAVKLFHGDEDADKEKAKENIASSVRGIMAGIEVYKENGIDAIKKEISDLEEKIELEKKELSQFLEQGMDGVNEAESILPEVLGKMLESLVYDIRSDFTDSSGVNAQSVKNAVKQAIKSGGNIKEAVLNITKEATKEALKKGRITADIVKETTEKILSGAVDTAEEMGKDVKEVTAGAFKGIQEGISSMADSIKNTTKEFVTEDLSETKEDLKTIKSLFLETVLKVGKRSGEVAEKVLNDLAYNSKKAGSAFKKETGSAVDKLSGKLKSLGKKAVNTIGETGGKATRVMADEAKALGKKTISVAKGSVTGMFKGAREALEKDKKE